MAAGFHQGSRSIAIRCLTCRVWVSSSAWLGADTLLLFSLASSTFCSTSGAECLAQSSGTLQICPLHPPLRAYDGSRRQPEGPRRTHPFTVCEKGSGTMYTSRYVKRASTLLLDEARARKVRKPGPNSERAPKLGEQPAGFFKGASSSGAAYRLQYSRLYLCRPLVHRFWW